MISAKEANKQSKTNNSYDTIHAQYEAMYRKVKSYYSSIIEKAIESATKRGKYEVDVFINSEEYEHRTSYLFDNPLLEIIYELADLGYYIFYDFACKVNSLYKLNISWEAIDKT
jgi:hypothetical protein